MLRARPLENWITLSEAAEILGVSPQAVHQWCENGTITEANLRRVGKGKPTFLVHSELILTMATERQTAAEEAQEALVEKDRSRARRRSANRPQLEYMDGSES